MVEDAVRREVEGSTEVAPTGASTGDEIGGSGSIDGAGLTPATKLRPPGLLELENLLAAHLDTRVSVQMTAKKGRVTIEFADLEDLERIYRVIAG
jgi:ParB family chromosome partitioning protein